MALTATTSRAPGPTIAARAERGAAVAWALLVVVGLVWGTASVADAGVSLRAAPLMGSWDWRPGPRLAPAVGVGVLVTAHGPGLAARVRWRVLLWLTGATATAWAVALAAADGWDRVTSPLTTRHEYEPLAAGIGDIGAFVTGFTDRIGGQPIHVQGHPPGPVVLAWALDRIGLGGAGWLAALALAGWGAAAAAVLVCCRAVAGEAAARRAAPALAVLPAAVWAGTSLDALFAGLTAAGASLVVVAVRRAIDTSGGRSVHAVTRRATTARGRAPGDVGGRSTVLALGGGLVLGGALLCSYGALPVLAIAAAAVACAGRGPAPSGETVSTAAAEVAVHRRTRGRSVVGGGAAAAPGAVPDVSDTTVAEATARRRAGAGAAVRTGAIAATGTVAVVVAAAATGFHWLDGLAATRAAYWSGVAADRPGRWLTLVGNPAALALASGPAVAVGLAGTLGRVASAPGIAARAARRAALLPVAALLVVAAVDLSQMSRGEVERIWLPFVPWLALAAPGDRRGLLAAQVGLALLLQSALRSPW